MTVPCLLTAWSNHMAELRGYLRHRSGCQDEADDLLQEVFMKAMRQGALFCSIENPRAWFFQVARNALADRLRCAREHIPLPADVPAPNPDEHPVVDDLSQCLPRVLSELSAEDRLAITLCDIEGHSQQVLAERLGISLPGAKSRIQRARLRLREQLVTACKVSFDDNGEVCCFVPRPAIGE
ncbi:MAG: RNA polymerase sigma factor SigZ [Candidatus Dechloromonas phosphoritropha]|jgi:RNA polymerase sigma-70 factor (ECF subfamily)|nr:RNA polymerase sigma factor SigZ [Candidatus Dechloromonas phosphoritropha]MBP8786828.1 RNA polymerase sigma factor SigZ [Azonexus sp.]MBP9227564.1 RNA polymerase sigma factor SigZ [Azonexus sp.]